MAVRKDESIEVDLYLGEFGTRSAIRDFLLNRWISERPQSKYRYYVENLSTGSRIYLERPGQLNKGCDFVIFVENLIEYKNGNDRPPRLDFLIDDLTLKKSQLTSQQWQAVLNALKEIHAVAAYAEAVQHVRDVPQSGLPYETVLKLSKWFFIEQDITYWAGSGRDMLFGVIEKI